MLQVHESTPRLEAAMARYGIKNSTAIQVDSTIFFSGLTAVDLETGLAIESGIAEQARYTLELFRDILADLGLSLDHVVKVNAHLADVADFAGWNDVFLSMFDPPYPCRTTVGAALVIGRIEIEILAATEPRR